MTGSTQQLTDESDLRDGGLNIARRRMRQPAGAIEVALVVLVVTRARAVFGDEPDGGYTSVQLSIAAEQLDSEGTLQAFFAAVRDGSIATNPASRRTLRRSRPRSR